MSHIFGTNCRELQTYKLLELEETFSEEIKTQKEKVTCSKHIDGYTSRTGAKI